jgi:hypothetical protein
MDHLLEESVDVKRDAGREGLRAAGRSLLEELLGMPRVGNDVRQDRPQFSEIGRGHIQKPLGGLRIAPDRR